MLTAECLLKHYNQSDAGILSGSKGMQIWLTVGTVIFIYLSPGEEKLNSCTVCVSPGNVVCEYYSFIINLRSALSYFHSLKNRGQGHVLRANLLIDLQMAHKGSVKVKRVSKGQRFCLVSKIKALFCRE